MREPSNILPPSILLPNAVKISGRQRKLIALLRRAFAERTVEKHAGAAAISTGQFVIDENGHADLDATGTDIIFGYQRVDECDDHCGLRRCEIAKNIGAFAVSG